MGRIVSCLWLACAAAGAQLEPIAQDLWLHRDAANVYVVRNGPRAILIDLGGGGVFDALPAAGIRQVEAIYLTHRDRDQWHGFARAVERGVPIYAPGLDPDRFGYTSASIRRYWSEFFPVRASRFIYSVAARETDAVRAEVLDGAELKNPVAPLRALATPGHTNDHVAYLANVHGRKVAFTGDAIFARGKVWQGFQLDWDHWRGTGQEAAFQSLLKLREQRPEMLAPSHGEVMREGVEETLLITAGRLWEAARLKSFELFALTRTPPLPPSRELPRLESFEAPRGKGTVKVERLSRHLWLADNNYFLLADDGACFAVDNRLPPALWKPVLERIGARRVDYLFVSHLHADHLGEIPALKRLHGFQVLAVAPLADLLEHPGAYWHPYANFDGIKPDRILRDGEQFEWKGYRFRAFHAPGQTWFHSFLETTVDGHRAVFSGDSFYPVGGWDIAKATGGWSGLNRGFPLYHSASARLMLAIRPEWVLAEHAKPFAFAAAEWNARIEWGERTARVLDSLSPSGQHLFDFNPHVFSVYPLISTAPQGQVEFRVANPFDEPLRAAWRVSETPGVEVQPASGELTAPAKSTAAQALRFRVRAPGRSVVPIGVTARGQDYGQPAFFLVDTAAAPR